MIVVIVVVVVADVTASPLLIIAWSTTVTWSLSCQFQGSLSWTSLSPEIDVPDRVSQIASLSPLISLNVISHRRTLLFFLFSFAHLNSSLMIFHPQKNWCWMKIRMMLLRGAGGHKSRVSTRNPICTSICDQLVTQDFLMNPHLLNSSHHPPHPPYLFADLSTLLLLLIFYRHFPSCHPLFFFYEEEEREEIWRQKINT